MQFKQHPKLEEYLAERELDAIMTRVVIHVDQPFAHYLHWERKYFGFKEESIKDDRIEMIFDVKIRIWVLQDGFLCLETVLISSVHNR